MSFLPWVRHRTELREARESAAAAREAADAAAGRVEAAHALVKDARESTNLLKSQIRRNGWTELLQAAWGRRA